MTTYITLVRPLAGVHPDVHLELALVQEAGAAKVTQMALDAGVLDHVRVQRGQRQVALVALLALVLLVRAAVGLDVDPGGREKFIVKKFFRKKS